MPTPTPSLLESDRNPTLSRRTSAATSSAIRDLLDQAKQPGVISLAGGLPDPALFPRHELAEIAAQKIRDGAVLQYGTSQGEVETRQALTALFQPADLPPDQLANRMVVTTGAQQSIDLLASVLLDPGDVVVVGNPDYLGALQIFRAHHAELAPISIDSDGLDTTELEHALRGGLRPKACYVVKNFHNPTGSSLSPERMRHLGDLAARYNFLIIDDDPYRELYDTTREPSAACFPDERTASLRSTSKTLSPGLRIGAMVAPDWLLEPVIIAKQSCDLHTSTLSQAIVAEALEAPWYQTHLERVRTSYARKRSTLVSAVRDEFGERATFKIPAGGMFLWANIAGCDDTTQWLQRGLANGVCFVPGTTFATSPDPSGTPLSNYLRLSYATGSPTELVEAVRRLASCC